MNENINSVKNTNTNTEQHNTQYQNYEQPTTQPFINSGGELMLKALDPIAKTVHDIPTTLRVSIGKKKKSFYENGTWIQLPLDSLYKLLYDYDLSMASLKIFSRLIKEIEVDNHIYLCQKQLADEMGISIQAFNNAFRPLVNKGILLKHEPVGNGWVYKLNKDIACYY